MSDLFDYMHESLKDDSFDCHLEFVANVLENGHLIDIVFTADFFGAIDLLNQMNLDDLENNNLTYIKDRLLIIRELNRFMIEGIMEEEFKEMTLTFIEEYRKVVA